MADPKVSSLSSFVWSIAEILRGDFKQSEYGKIVLPFVVLRRLDCILADTKRAVLDAEHALADGVDDATRDMILFGTVGGNVKVYNLSRFSFDTLKGQDPGQLHENLIDYVTKFSPNVRDIFLDKFLFTDQLKRLKEGGILWNVFERFTEIDLHPDAVSNIEMGYLFEELIRRFSEISNETAGEHFTPREVIRLIVDLMIANDDAKLTGRGIIRQVYDPACGTGGMLALTEEALKGFNSSIRVELFGQELNGESYGICKSDMLVTGHDPDQIAYGKVQLIDASGETFWKSMRKSLGSKRREIPDAARDEIVRLYTAFADADGEVSKVFDTTDFGYREVRVERPLRLNFQASDERIARLADEKAFVRLPEDQRDAIEAALRGMPDDLITNRDRFDRRLTQRLKAAGVKVGAPIRKAILSALSERDEDADVCTDARDNPEPDSDLRDHELVPLGEDWQEYVAREVTPFVADAWVDETHRDASDGEVGRVGYEINFNRYFYRYVPPRPLEEIDADGNSSSLGSGDASFASRRTASAASDSGKPNDGGGYERQVKCRTHKRNLTINGKFGCRYNLKLQGELMMRDPTKPRRRILVVEDHWLVAMEAKRMLEDQDCEVVGPFGSVSDASASAIGAELDGAILDVDLGGETSLALAGMLRARGVPFAFATGYDATRLPEGFQSGAHLDKPYSAEMVRRFLAGTGLDRR